MGAMATRFLNVTPLSVYGSNKHVLLIVPFVFSFYEKSPQTFLWMVTERFSHALLYPIPGAWWLS